MTAPFYNGMYHPGVIQEQGAGEAIAGGLNNVLAALLHSKELNQQNQAFQANLAEKQAQTEQAIALAKKTGADTDYLKTQNKQLQQKIQDAQDNHQRDIKASGWLMSQVAANPNILQDSQALSGAMQKAFESGTLDHEDLTHVLPFVQTVTKTSDEMAKARNDQAVAAANAQRAPLAGAEAAAGINQKNSAALLARAGAAKDFAATQEAQQKAQDQKLQRYLQAAGNDPLKAYAKYVSTDPSVKKGAQTDPTLFTRFQALASSPVTGLKPADIRAATSRFDKALKDAGDLKTRGSTIGAAATSLRSALTNPAGYGSAISKFVQAVDQDKNLRYQLLKYYEHNIDPQAPMLLSRFINKNFQGKLPPQMAQDMFRHIADMRNQYKGQYDNIHDFYAQKYPEAAAKFEPSDVYFGNDADFQGAAPAAAAGGGNIPNVDDLFPVKK